MYKLFGGNMSKHCFLFLEKEFSDISSECESCEKHLVEKNFEESLFRAGKACELITKEIAINIEKPELVELNQYERLNHLFRRLMVIPSKFESSFNRIRKSRNDVVHNKIDSPEDYSYQMHKRLFDISVWFYSEFGHEDFVPPEYNGPIYKSEKVNASKIYGKIDSVSKNVQEQFNYTQNEINELRDEIAKLKKSKEDSPEINTTEEDNLSEYHFEQKNYSFLLNELFKLNVSSSESVENENNLNNFKNYIHVDRSIQTEFIDELERVADEDSSHLVMLCGSVGDGKSHMLAYLKTHRPDLFNKFTIHGDATESYFTNKNDEDTLSEVLSSFNDENIESSYEKLILAINLGILNNFLESDYSKNEYTKLKQIIEEANIFDSDVISQNIIQDKVSFITFSDYNLFELNGDYDSNYVSSVYISAILDKITSSDYYNNPFYRAYLMDKEIGYFSPVIYNYEMLCDKEVQKVLIDYIIRVFVEHKKIISTRDLFNAIYELIVPPELIEYTSENTINDFVDYLLPNMLFSNIGRSKLLKFLSHYDPTTSRSEKLDNFIIKFNTSSDLRNILDEYYDTSRLEFLEDYFKEYHDLLEGDPSGKQYLIKTLIRLAIFYGKSNFKRDFIDEDYLTYLKYLYSYNIQNHSQYQNLFLDIKKAIFNLKGSFKKDYICIDELESFKVSKELKLKYYPDSFVEDIEKLSNRFKTSIRVYFSVPQNKNKIPLEVDYPLYSAICKLNKGYKPNKFERETLVLFEEFINSLVNETSSDDLFIKNIDNGAEFTFEYNEDFDSFSFEKGG